MGIGSSCYPVRRDHNMLSFDQEPYDAKRLLSELITVQTAIILTEGVVDDMKAGADSKNPNRRQSIEYTITTSLSLPGLSRHNPQDNRPGDRKLDFTGRTIVDIMNAHFKTDMNMPSIQEISEVSVCS